MGAPWKAPPARLLEYLRIAVLLKGSRRVAERLGWARVPPIHPSWKVFRGEEEGTVLGDCLCTPFLPVKKIEI